MAGMFIRVSEDVAAFLKQLPWGFRSKFVELVLREAIKDMTVEKAVAYVLTDVSDVPSAQGSPRSQKESIPRVVEEKSEKGAKARSETDILKTLETEFM